jgi:hypothetical protein
MTINTFARTADKLTAVFLLFISFAVVGGAAALGA